MYLTTMKVPGGYGYASSYCNERGLSEFVLQFESVDSGDSTVIVFRFPSEFISKQLGVL